MFVLGGAVSCGAGDGKARERVEVADAPDYLNVGDHFVADVAGSYICVLRRPDELAGLRAQYSSPSTVSLAGVPADPETNRSPLRQVDPRTAAVLGR